MGTSFGQGVYALTHGSAPYVSSRSYILIPLLCSARRKLIPGLFAVLMMLLSVSAFAVTNIGERFSTYQLAHNACNATPLGCNIGNTTYVLQPYCRDGNGAPNGQAYVWEAEYPATNPVQTHWYMYGCTLGLVKGCSFTESQASGSCGAERTLGTPQCGKGNPCNAATGNKYQPEEDYRSTATTLSFVRSYNSQSIEDAGFGIGWAAPFYKRLEISGSSVQIRQADGRGEPFWCANNVCTGGADTKLALTQDSSGYTLTNRDKSTERYGTTGKLLYEMSELAPVSRIPS